MAFFKFRKAAGESVAPPPAPESVEAIRKRARYRLTGAALLVLMGVIGFPLVFDNQPRPIAVDIPIDIPDKAKAKPLAGADALAKPANAVASGGVTPPAEAPVVREPAAPVVVAATAEKPVVVAAKEPEKEEEIISPAKPAVAKPDAKPAAKPKAESPKADTAADKPAVGRFVVQFGAFTDAALAREARFKVERSGMKTYAQIAETAAGKKIRVRVGPFEKRSDAEKAAEKIKKVGLPAAILEL
jgi:DedD protein